VNRKRDKTKQSGKAARKVIRNFGEEALSAVGIGDFPEDRQATGAGLPKAGSRGAVKCFVGEKGRRPKLLGVFGNAETPRGRTSMPGRAAGKLGEY